MSAPCVDLFRRRGKSWPTFAWVATVPAKRLPLRDGAAIQRPVIVCVCDMCCANFEMIWYIHSICMHMLFVLKQKINMHIWSHIHIYYYIYALYIYALYIYMSYLYIFIIIYTHDVYAGCSFWRINMCS